MNPFFPKVRATRPDLSDYLFHFTKGREAKETITKILDCGELRDIHDNGVICFTEAPLLLLNDMFTIFEPYPDPMYARYGVAVNKDYLFDLGARNVIYGSRHDPEASLQATKWRFESYVPGVRDYTWLREWRLPRQALVLDPAKCFLIAPTNRDLDLLIPDWQNVGEVEYEGELDNEGRIYGSKFQRIRRGFKGLSFEQLAELNSISSVDMQALLGKQRLGEEIGIHDLGAFVDPQIAEKPISSLTVEKVLKYLETL